MKYATIDDMLNELATGTRTVYRIHYHGGTDYLAMSDSAVTLFRDELRKLGDEWEDYDVERITSLSSNRTDEEPDFALEIEVPAELHARLTAELGEDGCDDWPESLFDGYAEDFDENKFGSWDYRYVADTD